MIDVKLPSSLGGWFVWLGVILVLITSVFTAGSTIAIALVLIVVYVGYLILDRFHRLLKNGRKSGGAR